MSEEALRPLPKLVSDWQQPVNRWAELPNSIHNDSVATKIGMRGGTIPGTVHLNHFVPLIQNIWGKAWYERGAISMYYTFATTDRENVRAVIDQPSAGDSAKVNGYVETPEEKMVCKGSLSVGDTDEADYVANLPLEDAPRSELRILERLETGMQCEEKDDVVAQEGKGIVELPTGMFQMLNAGGPAGTINRAVGFYGATEIRTINGPIYVDRVYRRVGEVVCVGASPRTEFVWVDSKLIDQTSGQLVAEMRHFTRFMKASSDLWAS